MTLSTFIGLQEFTPRFCFAFMLLMYVTPAVCLDDNGFPDEITVATAPWIDFAREDGTGLYPDMLRLIYEPLGIKINTIIFRPRKRALLLVVDNQADVFVGAYSQDDSPNSLLLTPRFPINTDRAIAVFHKNSDLTWEEVYEKNRIDAPDNVVPYNMVWAIGYNYDKHLGLKKIHEVKQAEQGLKMLARGRLDVLIDAIDDIRYIIETDFPEMKAILKWDVIYKRNLYMAFSNNLKGAKLCEIFDQRMEHLLSTGELERLYKKWGKVFAEIDFVGPNPHGRMEFCQATINTFLNGNHS